MTGVNKLIHARSVAVGCLLALARTQAHAQALAMPVVSAPPDPLAQLFIEPDARPALPTPVATLDSASPELQATARWIVASKDNAGMPYLLVDKANARVYAFDFAGRLQSSTPALLGMTKGDTLKVSNETTMAQMTEHDRITPAGRYLSRLAIDSDGKELLVIDYAAAISLHPVVKGTPQEHRAERLASATSDDNRISFGCINVPPDFYATAVHPAFTGRRGVVYILPEMSAAAAFFGFQPANGAAGASALAGVQAAASTGGAPTSPAGSSAPPVQAVAEPDLR